MPQGGGDGALLEARSWTASSTRRPRLLYLMQIMQILQICLSSWLISHADHADFTDMLITRIAFSCRLFLICKIGRS